MPKIRIVLTDDDGTPTRDLPKGNDRMFGLEIHNRGRVQRGTATIHRLAATVAAVLKRYPRAVKSRNRAKPMVLRRSLAGPIVIIVTALDGPVASHATKH